MRLDVRLLDVQGAQAGQAKPTKTNDPNPGGYDGRRRLHVLPGQGNSPVSGAARIPMLVDGVTHLTRAMYYDKMACGLVVYDRTFASVMKMYVEGTGRDVDCMTCLVIEARSPQ